ncbi:MAG: sodium:proton antiporter [Clostridia bacterium BRH_c25]|nr:MAG: sodium:proton antiporter [Clostridia bacterium BRH_c25]
MKQRIEFFGGYKMALIPMIVFAIFCVLFFVVFKVFEMEALALGGVIGLVLGAFLSKDWKKYWEAVVEGVAMPMNGVLIMILFVVGIFSALMAKGGVAQGFVWLGSAVGLHGGMFTAFTFLATCIMATATGTSIGTLFSAFPILYPSGILLGANPVMLAGAILSGAIFGDNLAPISDTTIASASTQSYTNKEGSADIGGVVATRFKFSIIAAAIAFVLYLVLGGGGTVGQGGAEILAKYTNPKGLIMLIPVVVLLTIAIKTREIFTAIVWGTITGTIVALVFGIITPKDIFFIENGTLTGFLYGGIKNMVGIVMFCITLFGIIGVLNASGTMDNIIQAIVNSNLAKTPRGTEIAIALGIMSSCLFLGAASGPAIIMFGPIANEIGKSQKLHPYRRANLIDGFANTLPTVIPVISAFVFIVLIVVQGLQAEYSFIQAINPISLAAASFHPLALFAVLSYSVFTGWGRDYEGPKGEPVKSLPAKNVKEAAM